MDPAASPVTAQPSRWAEFLDSDFVHRFCHSPVVIVAFVVALVLVLSAALAGIIAPHNPLDLATLDLGDARLPPAWVSGGSLKYVLGTDEQGRDILSAIMYGSRISIVVGGVSVLLSLLVGVSAGLIAGYAGGRIDALIMRLADVQLSFPSILLALMVSGVLRTLMPHSRSDHVAFAVLVLSIAATGWVQYARTVRGVTLVEKNREYVQAARVIGVSRMQIMFGHLLPNVIGPVLVVATVHVATAITLEATLSFLGVGVPPTSPSLGTLINDGNQFLYSGEWWIAVFPGIALVALVLSVNLLGDWLRDALNPRLQ